MLYDDEFDFEEEESSKSALIIDDSDINREILSFYLQEQGYETFFAEDGEEGVNSYNNINPSITFLDIVMPKLSGLEVLREIKKINPNAIVIMVSSYVSKHNLQKAKELNANWFLMKPFTKEKLVEIVKRFKRI
ncbi:MAG: two-component system response regulator [Bacteroidetes bacterium]|nr:MAG: two-component system response regulator [Bacteroidota bacterium]